MSLKQRGEQLRLPFRGVREMEIRIKELEMREHELHRLGKRLVQEFKERFPDAPAYLTRYADKTWTSYRWRRPTGYRSRGKRPTAIYAPFELTSDTGRELLQSLPIPARGVWLDFERRRIELNFMLAITGYERYRIGDLLSRIRQLREMERN